MSDDMLKLDLDLQRGGRRQQVYLRREVIKPDLEMVQIDAAICLANEVDLTQVFLEAGQLIAGSPRRVVVKRRPERPRSVRVCGAFAG